MLDVIIIGGGLFGQIIGGALRLQDRSVMIIDDNRSDRGSTPAACLMKPQWMAKMNAAEYRAALGLLDKLYGVHQRKFEVMMVGRKRKQMLLDWVDPHHVLGGGIKEGMVRQVRKMATSWATVVVGEEEYQARYLICCTGIWQPPLATYKVPGLVGMKGIAFTWKGLLDPGLIRLWAPYKQLIAFERGPGEVWCGDGTSLKPDSWSTRAEAACRRRCNEHISEATGQIVSTNYVTGIRPKVIGEEKPAFLYEAYPHIWVATGGAKNGTLGAAWAAQQLMEVLK